jgi:hypothetical protein
VYALQTLGSLLSACVTGQTVYGVRSRARLTAASTAAGYVWLGSSLLSSRPAESSSRGVGVVCAMSGEVAITPARSVGWLSVQNERTRPPPCMPGQIGIRIRERCVP